MSNAPRPGYQSPDPISALASYVTGDKSLSSSLPQPPPHRVVIRVLLFAQCFQQCLLYNTHNICVYKISPSYWGNTWQLSTVAHQVSSTTLPLCSSYSAQKKHHRNLVHTLDKTRISCSSYWLRKGQQEFILRNLLQGLLKSKWLFSWKRR